MHVILFETHSAGWQTWKKESPANQSLGVNLLIKLEITFCQFEPWGRSPGCELFGSLGRGLSLWLLFLAASTTVTLMVKKMTVKLKVLPVAAVLSATTAIPAFADLKYHYGISTPPLGLQNIPSRVQNGACPRTVIAILLYCCPDHSSCSGIHVIGSIALGVLIIALFWDPRHNYLLYWDPRPRQSIAHWDLQQSS